MNTAPLFEQLIESWNEPATAVMILQQIVSRKATPIGDAVGTVGPAPVQEYTVNLDDPASLQRLYGKMLDLMKSSAEPMQITAPVNFTEPPTVGGDSNGTGAEALSVNAFSEDNFQQVDLPVSFRFHGGYLQYKTIPVYAPVDAVESDWTNWIEYGSC